MLRVIPCFLGSRVYTGTSRVGIPVYALHRRGDNKIISSSASATDGGAVSISCCIAHGARYQPVRHTTEPRRSIKMSTMRKRTVALIITLSMLITILPSNIIVGSVADYHTPSSEHIGAVAKIVDDDFPLADNPSDMAGTHVWSNLRAADMPERVIITNYYYDASVENSEPMYEIDAAVGYEWPSMLKNYHWIQAKSVDIVEENGETGVIGGDGKVTDSLELERFDRGTLLAKTSLRGDVSYQWQIRYDTPKDLWADIQGECDREIEVTYGLILSLLDEFRSVAIRCESTTDTKINHSEPITVTSVPLVSDLGEVAATVSLDDEGTAVSGAGRALRAARGVTPLAENDTYNVVINYNYEDGSTVYQSHTANIGAGTNYNQTVTFPVIKGYLPYIDNARKDSYTFNITNIQADVTVNVVYKPTDVNYTVIHYQQNVDNDDYSLVATDRNTGLTGAQVPEVHKEFEGFYNLAYERPTIAADGSTVIEVYYDRYYYLLNFDMTGGYGTDTVYARFGATIPEIKDPTKAGHNFIGWSETENGTETATLPDKMPAYADGAKTYYAIWKMVDTAKVTIVFWGENPNDEGYSYLADSTKDIYLKPGKEFTYTEGEMMVCDREVHTHTDACLGCGKTAHTHSAVGGACYTLTCTVENHTHGTGCYTGVGDQQNVYTGLPDNPQNGQVYDHWYYDNLIYINGSWYKYTGTTASGSIAPTTCGKTEVSHTHTNDCYALTCTTEEHTHTNPCYTCGQEAHTHNSECYMQGAGLDTTKWKFVRSDTVTVAADGSTVVNVYYDRTTFKLEFYSRDGSTHHGTIEDKWGSQIGDRFLDVNSAVGGNLWMTTRNGNSGPYTPFLEIMPNANRNYYLRSTSTTEQKAYYYVEKLDASGYDEKYVVIAYSGSSLHPTEEDFMDIEGFTFKEAVFRSNNRDITVTEKGEYDYNYDNSKFYYTRNSYTLTFNDGYNDVREESVKYQAPLAAYNDYVPEVPSEYEPGSVEFAGWYQNPQCTGEKYKLDEHTMPANDLILYAKWVPVNHTVEFYLTESSEDIYHPADVDQDASFVVPHGDYIAEDYLKAHLNKASMNNTKPNGDYTFVYWYYIEDGVKHPFDPSTSIRKDLKLYGEWSSNTLKEYTIMYVLKNDHNVRVADDTHGSGLAGSTKTFEPKGSEQLYTQYQDNYFPTVKSKSVILDIDANEIIVIFEYESAQLPYTVRYLEAGTNNVLHDPKVVSDNTKAVVTETFVPINGYMPDAYQKRLVVSTNGGNEIIFYYTKDEVHAYYKVTHYIQNTDGTTWSEYKWSDSVGDIGTRYTASPIDIQGFTYKETKYVAGGTQVTDVTSEGAVLTAEGLEIDLYYVRNQYPYQVRYLEQGTGKELAEPKNGKGLYGATVTENAIDIASYDKVAPTTATITIRIEEGADPTLNIITFYYKIQTVTINYKVAVGEGTVSPASETVELDGVHKPIGSTPTAGAGYRFDGWYTDEACTTPVDADWIASSGKINPPEAVAATYYAKFVPANADLKIEKKFPANTNYSEVDKNQTFVFEVKGTAGTATADVSLTVTVHGAGSITVKDLPIGTYTVTEKTDWSWRYEPTGDVNTQTVTLSATGTNTVTFTNERKEDKWLDGDSSCVNIFSGKKTAEID